MKVQVKSFKNIDRMQKIIEIGEHSLYLGDYVAARTIKDLKTVGITAILTTAAGLPLNCQLLEIKHKSYQAMDAPSYKISKHFKDSYEFIERQIRNGNVLVHCAAGISRSATIVIAYLMKKKSWTAKRSQTFVKTKRSIISPNYGFLKQLEKYQTYLNNEITFKTKIEQTNISKQPLENMKTKTQVNKQCYQKIRLSQHKNRSKLLLKNSIMTQKPDKVYKYYSKPKTNLQKNKK